MSEHATAGDKWLREQARPRGVVGQEPRDRSTPAERTSDAVRQAADRLRRRQQLPDSP